MLFPILSIKELIRRSLVNEDRNIGCQVCKNFFPHTYYYRLLCFVVSEKIYMYCKIQHMHSYIESLAHCSNDLIMLSYHCPQLFVF